jgi:hypothetical protein
MVDGGVVAEEREPFVGDAACEDVTIQKVDVG